jgi:branched-chain amino acid transport system ATP-binding protein
MPLLEARALDAFYGDFQALFGVSVEIAEGEIVSIIGANGAGKSTFLRALLNYAVRVGGAVRLDGEDIAGRSTERIARLGLALTPEGRALFPSLSVEENLLIGEETRRKGKWRLGDVYALFPALKELRHRFANQISGGQQQMVAIGRALLTNPRLLLCDEISLGLAPKVVKDIYRALPDIRGSGIAVLLVEQDVVRARSASDRLYCFLEGRVSLQGRSAEYGIDAISRAYFGA